MGDPPISQTAGPVAALSAGGSDVPVGPSAPLVGMLDSVQKPTQAQAELLYRSGWRIWAGNVFGDGVPVADLWTPADVDVVTAAGFVFLPIATVNWSLDQSGQELARGTVAACLAAGLTGAVALDTEYQERGNSHLVPTVDGFVRRIQAMLGWDVVIYTGAAYAGKARRWVPRWSASSGMLGPAPTDVPNRGAVQYAGDIDCSGVACDLSVCSSLPVTNHQRPDYRL